MKILASLALTLLFSVAHSKAKVIFVDASVVGGSGDGSSWVDAFSHLQDGLQVAVSGDEVWVAKGVYYPDEGGGNEDGDHLATFQLIGGVSLLGGFISGGSDVEQRDLDINLTILSGDMNQDDEGSDDDLVTNSHEEIVGLNSRHVVTLSDVNVEVVLDGFLVTGGSAGTLGGGGLLVEEGEGKVVVTDCRFLGNRASQSGGAVRLSGGTCHFHRCHIEGNASTPFGSGGGVSASSPVTLTECVFEANSAEKKGGGLFLTQGLVDRCRFAGNSAGELGGAVAVNTFAEVRILNSIFHNNEADLDGGAVHLKVFNLHAAELGSCTFSGNSASNLGGAVFSSVATNAAATFSHCLIWNNASKAVPDGAGGMVSSSLYGTNPEKETYRYCLAEGRTLEGEGNIDGTIESNAPLFLSPVELGVTDYDSVDLRMQSSSPTIDQGDVSALLDGAEDFDLDGNSRVVGGKPDIGAYEAPKKVVFVNVNTTARFRDGKSWETAFSALVPALKEAETGQEIWVAKGVYLPTEENPDASGTDDRTVSFELKSGVEIYGGFDGSEINRTERKLRENQTILNGDLDGNDRLEFSTGLGAPSGGNSYHIVKGVNVDSTAVLDGFAIIGGLADGSFPDQTGAGLLLDNGSPRIRNCKFMGNESEGAGGAVIAYNDSDPTFLNCLMVRNRATSGSAMTILSDQAGVIMIQCSLSSNLSDFSTPQAGAIYNIGGNIIFVNGIIWNNQFLDDKGSPELESIVAISSGTAAVGFSIVAGSNGSGDNWVNGVGTDLGGNLDVDPKFVGTTDYRLSYESSAIDAGDTNVIQKLLSSDLAGAPRIAGEDGVLMPSVDMGAYEYQGRAGSDTDGDGLSDLFEITYGLTQSATDLEADLDLDRDGWSNLAEYVFATSPLEADKPLVLQEINTDQGKRFVIDLSYNERSDTFVTLDFQWSENLADWFPATWTSGPLSINFPDLFRFSIVELRDGRPRVFVRPVLKKK